MNQFLNKSEKNYMKFYIKNYNVPPSIIKRNLLMDPRIAHVILAMDDNCKFMGFGFIIVFDNKYYQELSNKIQNINGLVVNFKE